MNNALPMCCNPEAFDLLKTQLEVIEAPDALVLGASAIAMHQVRNVEPAEVQATLNRYADKVRSRVHGSQPQALLAHLHDVLFEEEKFIVVTVFLYVDFKCRKKNK